jgi:hypothetical protein
MNKAICSLNFMYSMERFATATYKIQKGGFRNRIVVEKLTYAVDNERQHALKPFESASLNQHCQKYSLGYRLCGSIPFAETNKRFIFLVRGIRF